ncbi:MAG: DMT family transporter [Chromatiales bacterium]|nr:DMT family transporter [Chromatiales bacterium]
MQDLIIKLLSGSYPLHEVMFVRTSIAMVIILAVMRVEVGWGGLRTNRAGAHVARGVLIVIANSAYFLALAAMPLAEAMAVFFVAPLIITALSALILKEPVGPRRWAAVAVGMLGVIAILRPGGETFSPVTLLPVLGAIAYAIMQVITRRLGATDPASTMALYVQMTFMVVCLTMYNVAGDGAFADGDDPSLQFLLRAWVVPSTYDAGVMVLVGIIHGASSYLLTQAYRSAAPSVVAPFEYTALPLAAGLGFFAFGQLPDGLATLGIALIVSSGLYALYRETRRRQEARTG